MLRSMTGFGRCFLEEDQWTQVWEVRSVNSRYLDVKWRLPAHVRGLEAAFEKLVKRHASRGRLEITLFLQMHQQVSGSATFNERQASAMLDTLSRFAAARGDTFSPDYMQLMRVSALWDDGPMEQEDSLTDSLERGLVMALEDWNESRALEAEALEKDLLVRLVHMEEWLSRVRERAPEIKEERFGQLRDRVGEVLERFEQEVDESRFLQEITLLADKMDVSEELTRLDAHFERLRALLSAGKEVGRKLDFTMQEAFREITTCGNKIQDMQVSRIVVDLKNELEKCREQIQNIE